MTGSPTAGYNTFDEATDLRDPDGGVTRTAYDRLGRMTATTLPGYTPPGGTTALTSKVTRTYDAAGNPASDTDALGKTTTYTHDQLGNPAKVTQPAPTPDAPAPVSTFTYDLLGEQLSATDPTGARAEATYDDLGRNVTATQVERRPSHDAFTTTLAYDDAGDLLSATSPTGLATSSTYNHAGEPLTVTDTAGGVTTYTYGPTGLPASVTTPQNRTTRATYDLAGRVTQVSDHNSAGTVLRTTSSSYDQDGDPVAVTDPLGHTVTPQDRATHQPGRTLPLPLGPDPAERSRPCAASAGCRWFAGGAVVSGRRGEYGGVRRWSGCGRGDGTRPEL